MSSWRGRQHQTVAAVSILVATAMVSVLFAAKAHADDPPPTVPIEFDIATLNPSVPATITISPVTGQVLTISGIDTRSVSQQCFPLAGVQQTCLGASGQFRVEGEATTDRFFPGSDAHAALGWIVQEGSQVLAAIYDLPADGRVEQYARDELRAYIHERLLGIVDRAAYGLPLTADEQRALAFLQSELLTTDRLIAQAAVDEYQRFKTEGCAYVPPPAPAYVPNPEPIPASVGVGCRGQIGLSSLFSPPMPSASNFQAWGIYRVANSLGLSSLGNIEIQQNMAALARAGLLLAGIAAAGGAAALTSAVVGANTLLAAGITAIIAQGSVSAGLGGAFAVGFGAAAAGAIVGVVLISLVVAAIGIWQLVEAEQVGATLVARLAAVNGTTDPLGLATLRAANAGRDLETDRLTWVDEASRPKHRSVESSNRMIELVTRWSSVRADGSVRPDPTGIWADNATKATDFRFRLTAEDGSVSASDHLTVAAEGCACGPTVRFSDGWLVVTPSGGTPQASIVVEYIEPSGQKAYATRQQPIGDSDDQRWAVTRVGPGGSTTTIEDAIVYKTPSGAIVTAEILAGPPDVPTGARPTVMGPLLPGRTLHLRPNALNAAGEIDDEAFIDDFQVEWTVQRFDESTGAWVTDPSVVADAVGSNPTYGGRFTPSSAGRYRAQARIYDPLGLAPDSFGTVEFTVRPPTIDIVRLDVVDNHLADQLEVTVQASEPVPDDQITVKVEWPGTVGSEDPGPVTQTTLSCISGSPCGTNIVTLTHPTSTHTDLRGDVTVTFTNPHGSEVTRIVPVSTPARPSFTAPPVAPEPGQAGVVSFDDYAVHVQLPAGVSSNPNYVIAGIEPGESSDPDPVFMITDADNPGPPKVAVDVRGDGTFLLSLDEHAGQPVVMLYGVPRADDIGTYQVPILIQQSNGARRTLNVFIDVVAAPDDQYRAGLFSEVDPLDFAEDGPPAAEVRLLGGKAEWGSYDGPICIGFSSEWSDREHCGDHDEFFEPDGTPRPFPYHKVAPHGLSAGGGTTRIRAWLPESERSFAEPMEVAFILVGGATPPEITELSWDADQGLATLGVVASSPTVPIESVTCAIDAHPVGPCFDLTGGTWAPPILDPGDHLLEVLATDALGNYDSATLTFSVADPGEPTVLPGGAEASEADSLLRVPVTLSHPVAHEVTVEWSTLEVGPLIFDQATPDQDYAASSGTVTFAPGQVTAEVEIQVYDDGDHENDELVLVSFREPVGARMGGFWGLAFATILDDDWPKVVPGSATATEGLGEVIANVPVNLSQPSDDEVTVEWTTVYVGGLAEPEADPGDDYTPTSGTVTFAPGQTQATVQIVVRPDAVAEPDEAVIIRFHSPSGARLGGFWGLGFLRISDRT